MTERCRHSKISVLPLKIRLEVENQLIQGVTYAKISEYLQGLGYDIHQMSVYRYGKPFLKGYEGVKKAADIARMMQKLP